MRAIGGSALTDEIDVPKSDNRDVSRYATKDGSAEGEKTPDIIPITYVPARNTIFSLSHLLGPRCPGGRYIYRRQRGGYSGYPDCRPEYLKAFEANG